MLVNLKKQYVFVHIPKTGGRSIAAALNQNQLPPKGPIRLARSLFKRNSIDELAVSRYTRHETYEQFICAFPQRTGLAETTARQLLAIAFVRHPIARFVSLHRFLLKNGRKKYPDVPFNIDEWTNIVREGAAGYLQTIRSLRAQSDFTQGIVGEKFIGKFETIDLDFETVTRRLRIQAHLPHLNASGRKPADIADTSELSDSSLDFLCDKYARDFENFDYEMPT